MLNFEYRNYYIIINISQTDKTMADKFMYILNDDTQNITSVNYN